MTDQYPEPDYGELRLTEREQVLLARLRSIVAELHSELSRESTVHLVCLAALPEVRRLAQRVAAGDGQQAAETTTRESIASLTAAIRKEGKRLLSS